MKTKLPEVVFSKWVQWKNRDVLPDINCPGVYMLAKFRTVPNGTADPLDKNIIYFGETGRSLKTRWRQFDRAAFQQKLGYSYSGNHSGGKSYKKKYGDSGEDLYVSAFPVKDISEKLEPWFIRFQERKLLLDFVCKHGASNLLNKE